MIAGLTKQLTPIFLLLLALNSLVWTGSQVFAQDTTADQPGKVARNRLPSGWAADYDFKNLDVQRVIDWLRFAGVKPPTTLAGKVSGWVWAQASSRSWFALSDYRVEGELRSPVFDVEAWRIRDARVRFGYQNQKWTIGDASGNLQLAESKVEASLGVATFSAVLPTSPNALTEINGKLANVDLPAVLNAFQVEGVDSAGTGTIGFHATAKLKDLSDPLQWKANGIAELTQSSIASNPATDLSASWQLSDGKLKADRIEITLLERTFPTAASLDLSRPWDWSISIPEQSIEVLPALLKGPHLPELPNIRGTVLVQGDLHGDLLTQSTRAAIELASDSMEVADLQLKNLALSIRHSERNLQIDVRSAELFDTPWTASLAAEMQQPSNLAANSKSSLPWSLKRLHVRANEVRLERLRSLTSSLPIEGNGDLDISVEVPNEASWNWTDWQIKAVSRLKNLVVERVSIGDAYIDIHKEARQQNFSATSGNQIGETFWRLQGQVLPLPWQSFKFDLSIATNQFRFPIRWPLEDANAGLTEITPTGNVEWTGDASNIVQTGAFHFPIVEMMLDKVPLVVREARGTLTESQLELGSASLQFLGGELRAAGIWQRQEEGRHALRLTATDLDLRTLDALPIETIKKKIKGKLDIKIDVTKSSIALSLFEGWEGQASATAKEVQYQQMALGDLSIQAVLNPKSWTLKSEGELLKGIFTGSGTVSVADLRKVLIDEDPISNSMVFEFDWKNAQVDRLIPLWQSKNRSLDFRGRANIQGKVEWSSDEGWRSSTRSMLSSLAFRNKHIAKQVELELETTGQKLIVRRLQGALAHGRISGRGEATLGTKRNGDFQIQMDNVQLNEVTQLLDATWAPSLSGIADLKGDIRLRDDLTFSGDVKLAKAVVFEVSLERIHSNIRMSLGVDGKSMQIRCPSVEGVAFGGTLQGTVGARYGTGWSLDCQAHIQRGNVAEFSRFAGAENVLGKGLFDGDLILKSSRVRTVDDSRGTVTLAFRHTDAQSLPLFSQIGRFAPVLNLPSADFQRGMLHGDIGQGNLRIRDLNLWGNKLWVSAHGAVGLLNPRLDVDLTVYTGAGFEQRIASNLVASLTQNSIPSVAIVTRLNRIINNRAVFLNVSGTTAKPIIHPRAVRTFGRIALQSILEQALPVSGNAGLILGSASSNGTNATISK